MRAWTLLLVLLLPWGAWAGAGEYDFAIPEAEIKPYEIGGRLELRTIHHRLDDDSARYKLDYYRDDPGADTWEWRALVELAGTYRQGIWQAHLLTHHEYADTYLEDDWENAIYEGYLSLAPTAHITVDAGKKSILWGTGYAWNPAGFLNRPKDPDDPALNLEGRTLLGVDLIKSFTGGSLGNMGLTALLLPVVEDWANDELGEEGDLLAAVKLYLLWHDTDLDVIYFDGPDQPLSLGFDFAKNLAENIAIHGELAYRQDARRTVLDSRGHVRQTREDQLSYLLGIRYLNAYDTTFIAEYYHNGAGYDRSELEDFFAYQENAFRQWQSSGDASLIQRADRATRPYYGQRNFGEEYGYLKISQKEPFDILYFTPWIATIVNLQDGSFNIQPGMTWAAVTNLELNFRVGVPVGPANTEFGEKPDAVRTEFWARYYF